MCTLFFWFLVFSFMCTLLTVAMSNFLIMAGRNLDTCWILTDCKLVRFMVRCSNDKTVTRCPLLAFCSLRSSGQFIFCKIENFNVNLCFLLLQLIVMTASYFVSWIILVHVFKQFAVIIPNLLIKHIYIYIYGQ